MFSGFTISGAVTLVAMICGVVGICGLFCKNRRGKAKKELVWPLLATIAIVLMFIVVASMSLPVTKEYTIGFRKDDKIVVLRNDDGKAKTIYLDKVNRTRDRFDVGDEIAITTNRFGDVMFATSTSRETILRSGEQTPKIDTNDNVGDEEENEDELEDIEGEADEGD